MRNLSTLGAALCGTFVLSGLAAAQGGDDCSGATPIAGEGTFAVNTSSATDSSPNMSCAAGGGTDVWFAWTAPVTEDFEVTTCGLANWDTALQVYSGSCGNLASLSCNDDTCGLQSSVSFSAMAGSTYFLRVGSYNGGGGGVGSIEVSVDMGGGGGGGGCMNPTTGPDVIVGQIPNISVYGAVGGMSAYALGTTSCNVGDDTLLWISNNNQHPVIGQNIYRMEDGRFEQLGMSWLKHGFLALAGNVCCTCNNPGNGALLGVGCSDPYGSGLNGSQSGLGPRFQVNPFTGDFSYPFAQQGQSGDSVFKRIQVPTADVNPSLHPNAEYFGEAQYITPDDAAAGNGFNNVSYTPLSRNGGQSQGTYNLGIGGATVREEPAIRAWAALPTVIIEDINVPGEGQFVAGSNAIDNGDGTWRYEYAIFNNNSDFSGQSFTVPTGAGVAVTDVGMSFPMYHSGEPYTNVSWTSSVNAGSVSWETETFAQNSDANALRWGTMYSFWFTANAEPETVTAALGLFKPGNPGAQLVALEGPGNGGTTGAIITNYCTPNPNSTGVNGAIVASNVDLTARTMDLDALSLPANAFGFFITSTTMAFVPNPGGSAGNLCIAGSVGRGVAGGIMSTGAAGSFSGVVDLDNVATPTGTTPVLPGETRYFQAWHRDAVLGLATSNFTDGVRVIFP